MCYSEFFNMHFPAFKKKRETGLYLNRLVRRSDGLLYCDPFLQKQLKGKDSKNLDWLKLLAETPLQMPILADHKHHQIRIFISSHLCDNKKGISLKLEKGYIFSCIFTHPKETDISFKELH